MSFELFGIPFIFTPLRVILALILTSYIFWMNHLIHVYRQLFPYKKNKAANQSIFYLYYIQKDYFIRYRNVSVQSSEEFSTKCNQLVKLFNLNRMQKKEYREQFEKVLEHHSKSLEMLYCFFEGLKSKKERKTNEDLEEVLNRGIRIFNEMIIEINQTFQEKTPAA